MNSNICQVIKVMLVALFLAPQAKAGDQKPGTTETGHSQKSLLIDGFLLALESPTDRSFERPYKGATKALISEESENQAAVWRQGFQDRGVSTKFLAKRLNRFMDSQRQKDFSREDLFEKYRIIEVERPFFGAQDSPLDDAKPLALHAVRVDVEEESDDFFNDDLYLYFVVTHDDLIWGKSTDIYKGLDEGDSFFLSPKDRGLFGPKGERIIPGNNLIVDFGMIESDGDDVKELKALGDVIVDLALVALSINDPSAGVSAAKARAEVKNLMRLVVDLDQDDRLITDSIYLNPSAIQSLFEASSTSQLATISRRYKKDRFFSSFDYRLHFRLLR